MTSTAQKVQLHPNTTIVAAARLAALSGYSLTVEKKTFAIFLAPAATPAHKPRGN